MPRSESALPAELQDELDRLDAALAAVARGDVAGGAPGEAGAHDSAPLDGTAAPGAHDDPSADDLDRELLDLVAAVRTTRPALDPGGRARLEQRAEAAKAAPTPRTGLRFPAGRGWRLGLALGAVAAVAVPAGVLVVRDRSSGQEVTALSASPAAGGATSASADPTFQRLERGSRSSGGASSTDSAASTAEGLRAGRTTLTRQAAPSAPTSAAPLSATRRVIRDVEQTVRIRPGDVARAADRVTTIVQDAGGYLDSSQVRERGARAGGRFQVVVPAGRLDATVAALSRIGRPVRLERSGRDVTDRATSLEDRLGDLRADRDAARLQLARTVDPDRRAARRRELTLLSSRVAALRGQVVDLRRQTATSRIDLRLTTGEASDDDATIPAPDDGAWGIGDAWRDAGRVLEVGGGAVLIGGVVLLPLLVVGGLGLAARRHGLRRRREATIDGA